MSLLLLYPSQDVAVAYKEIAGALLEYATLAGQYNRSRGLASNLAELETVDGIISRARSINGVPGFPKATTSFTAQYARLRGVAGQLAELETLAGAIRRTKGLSGSLAETEAFSGYLVKIKLLAGSLLENEVLSGILSRNRRMTAVLTEMETLAGSIGKQMKLSGSLTEVETLSGSISRIKKLATTLVEASSLVGSIGRIRKVAGLLAESETLSAAVLLKVKLLAGAIMQTGDLFGDYSRARTIDGLLEEISNLVDYSNGPIQVVPTAPYSIQRGNSSVSNAANIRVLDQQYASSTVDATGQLGIISAKIPAGSIPAGATVMGIELAVVGNYNAAFPYVVIGTMNAPSGGAGYIGFTISPQGVQGTPNTTPIGFGSDATGTAGGPNILPNMVSGNKALVNSDYFSELTVQIIPKRQGTTSALTPGNTINIDFAAFRFYYMTSSGLMRSRTVSAILDEVETIDGIATRVRGFAGTLDEVETLSAIVRRNRAVSASLVETELLSSPAAKRNRGIRGTLISLESITGQKLFRTRGIKGAIVETEVINANASRLRKMVGELLETEVLTNEVIQRIKELIGQLEEFETFTGDISVIALDPQTFLLTATWHEWVAVGEKDFDYVTRTSSWTVTRANVEEIVEIASVEEQVVDIVIDTP